MVSQGRANKIAQRIQEELATLLLFEVSDPRVVGAYVTTIRVDKELAYANVFVSALEGAERKDEILEGLKHASGFLRSQLAQRTQLRFFPRLRFNWDASPEHVERIESLIESINTDRESDEDE